MSLTEKPAQPEPVKDDVNLDTDIVYFDSDTERQAALLALLHPLNRQDEELEKQLADLGWYKKELDKKAKAEAARTKAEAARKKRLAEQPGEGSAAKFAKQKNRQKRPRTRLSGRLTESCGLNWLQASGLTWLQLVAMSRKPWLVWSLLASRRPCPRPLPSRRPELPGNKNLKKSLADKLKLHKPGSGRNLVLNARLRLKNSRKQAKLAEKEVTV